MSSAFFPFCLTLAEHLVLEKKKNLKKKELFAVFGNMPIHLLVEMNMRTLMPLCDRYDAAASRLAWLSMRAGRTASPALSKW